MTLADTKHFNHRYMCNFTNYMTLLSCGVDSAVQEEGHMGQCSSHSCVVHDQGAGLWGLLDVTLVPSSAVPSVLPWVLSCAPLESLFCHQRLSFCMSPTTPCIYMCLPKCPSPRVSPRVYSHVSPPMPLLNMFPHVPLPLGLPKCLSRTCLLCLAAAPLS